MKFRTYFFLLLLPLTTATVAQRKNNSQSLLNKKEIRLEPTQAKFNPAKAFMYSTIFPGAGQMYNKRYWKVPIVWGGLAGGLYLINYHQNRYYTLKNDLYGLLRDISYIPPSGLTESQLRSGIDRSKRDRDLFTVLTVLWYILQAIEAHVDAHLRPLVVSPRLQVSVEPLIENNADIKNSMGLAVNFKF